MNLKNKLLISTGFLCLLRFSIINFISIGRLQKHHAEKYNINIPFVLAQGEIESHFGTKEILLN